MGRIFFSFLFLFIFNKLFGQETIQPSGQLEKLNINVNTSAHEAHPVVSPDGKTLFFSRAKYSQNVGGMKGGSDIWVAEQDSIGNWKPAANVGTPLNNEGNNYICSITPDGNTILLPNIYNANVNSNEPGISISRKTTTGWSQPQKLDIEYYGNKSDETSFYLSNDGKILLLSIEYFTSTGKEDIYVSFLKDNGTWSQPLNLGTVINTKDQEVSPFLASDGATLYFSSNGHKGNGSKDIFVSRRLDDTWKSWSKPVNMGPTINTPGMETSFVIPASGKFAYLVSNKNSDAHSDIYRVSVPEPVQPEAVVLVSGKVFNSKTNKPIQASIRYEVLAERQNLGIASSDPITGEYKIILPGGGKNYGFYAESKGFLSVNESLDAQGVGSYTEIKKDLYLTPIEIGEAITLKNVFFERSKATVLEESFPELDRLVKIMKDNPTLEIEIAGHTDNQGKADLNVNLSEERVQKVKAYLVSKGVGETRIQGKGYGGSKPIAPNDSETNRRLNRRVEFRILKK